MKQYRLPLLGIAWLVYMAFTIVGYPLFGISVILPSILLCGFSTWLHDFKRGLLTLFLTLPYNMLVMIYNQGDPQAWRIAIEPSEIATQMLAVFLVAIANSNRRKSLELTAILETRIQEKRKDLETLTKYMLIQSGTGHTDVEKRLYDIVTSQLTRLLIHSEALMNFLTYDNAPQAADAAKLVQIAEQNIEEVKGLARKLSLKTITETGIKQAFHEMCAYFTETADTCFSISISSHHREIPDQIALHIYRIAHEVVTNALRHGKAKHIDLTLELNNKACTLTILNNGKPLKKDQGEGIGMKMVWQRITTIHATARFGTTPDGQIRFKCTAPLLSHPRP